MAKRNRLQIAQFMSLTRMAGESLSSGDISALLASVDPDVGLIECCRIARVLTFEDEATSNALQLSAMVNGLRLFARDKSRFRQLADDRAPIVFHEHVLRVLILHFAARRRDKQVGAPVELVVPAAAFDALALSAMALNDDIGTEFSDVTNVSQRHVSWMLLALLDHFFALRA